MGALGGGWGVLIYSFDFLGGRAGVGGWAGQERAPATLAVL